MTFNQIAALLKQAGVARPESEASALLRHFCHVSFVHLMVNRDQDFQSDALEAAVRARETRVPLQYILGETDFYGETYKVTPAVLCPRPDTEILVEEAIARIPEGVIFGDLCTGSGCIAISTLAHRPDLNALAVDFSSDALPIAMENAEWNGVESRLAFLRFNLLSGRHPMIARLPVLVANPPYIPTATLSTLEAEVQAEPRMALDGGHDGLLFYRNLLSYYAPRLFLFEIGYDQGDEVCAMGREKGYAATLKKDLGGNDRLVILEKE